jgi:methionine aminotransferase
MDHFNSKLPSGGTTIFTVMSALARDHQAINLSQGFPDYDCPEELLKMVQFYLGQEKNQYAPMPGLPQLREVISRKMNRAYGCQLNGNDHVTVTAGATQAIFTFITAIIRPGDEVIIFEPAYDSYVPSIKLSGGMPKPYRMVAPDYTIDWDIVKAMCNRKTRMIIINSPHNPTGRVLRQEDMEALEAITSGTDILILSDEVYEHLIYDGIRHESIMRYPGMFDRSVAIYSFGKTFHSTGWKMGYCVGPSRLTKEFRNIHQWNVFSVNSFLQYALADYLVDEGHYNYLPGFYEQKRDLLNVLLKNPKLQPLLCQGTYFQLYDYSAMSEMEDVAFAKKVTEDYGVASIPVSVFYTEPVGDKVIRLCFAKKESTLISAAEKINGINKV